MNRPFSNAAASSHYPSIDQLRKAPSWHGHFSNTLAPGYDPDIPGARLDFFRHAAQSALFPHELPKGFEIFAGNFAWLNIRHLGLSEEIVTLLILALANEGLRIPCSTWRMRVVSDSCLNFFLVEPSLGTERQLPENWLSSTVVPGSKPDIPLWIGHRIIEQHLNSTLNSDDRTIFDCYCAIDRTRFEVGQWGLKLLGTPDLPEFCQN